jgi:molybdopterin synthase catalytic subunit
LFAFFAQQPATAVVLEAGRANMGRECSLRENRRMSLPRVSIQTADFDLGVEIATLRAQDARVGAVCSFVGTVRDRHPDAPGQVTALELEHYPGMTERAIEAMVDEAFARFPLYGARVVHRVGPLAPTDQIVLVAVTSAHRGASFQACEFLMDYLKTQAPFWKKEQTPEGGRWVDARVSDDAALARWGITVQNA